MSNTKQPPLALNLTALGRLTEIGIGFGAAFCIVVGLFAGVSLVGSCAPAKTAEQSYGEVAGREDAGDLPGGISDRVKYETVDAALGPEVSDAAGELGVDTALGPDLPGVSGELAVDVILDPDLSETSGEVVVDVMLEPDLPDIGGESGVDAATESVAPDTGGEFIELIDWQTTADIVETCDDACGELDAPDVGCPHVEMVMLPGGSCCTPDCEGRECGTDGCSAECGECAADAVCTTVGTCCEPNCAGKECGPDGCGGTCGQCGPVEACAQSSCCETNCAGKVCGADGCAGTCGFCSQGSVCHDSQCVDFAVECDDGNDEPWDGCDAESSAVGPIRVDIKTVFDEFLVYLDIDSVSACPTSNGKVVVTWWREEDDEWLPGSYHRAVHRVMAPLSLGHCNVVDGGSGGPSASSPWPMSWPSTCARTVTGGVSVMNVWGGCLDGGWECVFLGNARIPAGACSINGSFLTQLSGLESPVTVRQLSPAYNEDLWLRSGDSFSGIRFLRFDANGNVLQQGDADWSDQFGASKQFDSVVLDSQFLAVAIESETEGLAKTIEIVLSNRYMELIATLGEMEDESGASVHSPSVARIDTETLAVAGITQEAEGQTQVTAGVLGTDGAWTLPPVPVSDVSDAGASAPRLAFLGDELLALVWLEKDSSGERLKGKVMSTSGEGLSEELILAESLPGDLEQPLVMGLNDGSFAVVWLQDLNDGAVQREAIFLQRLNRTGGKMWGQCNNGQCDEGESCQSCPKDCGPCGE